MDRQRPREEEDDDDDEQDDDEDDDEYDFDGGSGDAVDDAAGGLPRVSDDEGWVVYWTLIGWWTPLLYPD